MFYDITYLFLVYYNRYEHLYITGFNMTGNS